MLRIKNGLRGVALAAAVCLCWPSLAMAQSGAARLPIAEGFWVDDGISCGQAQSVFVHSRNRFGEMSVYDGQVEGTVEPVTSLTRMAEGFLAIDDDPDGYVYIKPLPNSRAMVRVGSRGATGRDFFEDIELRQCPAASLPAGLRTAVAAYSDGNTAVPASTGADQPGPPVPPLGIAAGYYAEGEEPCGGNGILFYFDGRNYAWIDLSPFQPGLLTPVGQPRRAGAAFALEDGSMTVASPTRFIWRDINGDIGDSEMRWCPAGEVRASARAR